MGGARRRGRGRGRRDREADHETTHDPVSDERNSTRFVSSPMLPRYLTRHAKAATLGECGTSNPPLRGPIRGIKITPPQHSPEDVVQHAAASASNFSSIPHKTVLVPTNFGDHRPNKKDVGKSVMAAGSTNCSTQDSQDVVRVYPVPSFNVTEYVQKQGEDSPEVESDDPAFVCVNGLKVKNRIAPLLGRIFHKYGDITAGSDIKSSTILSYCLERVCAIYERLEHTTLDGVTLPELTNMCDEVLDLEHQKLNLEWLRKRLEYICGTKACIPDEYFAVKEEVAKNEFCVGVQREKLERYTRECAVLQEMKRAAEEELRAAETKLDRSKEKYLDMRARITSLKHQGLVHGLL